MSRIVRFLAVVALALSPVWGVPSVHAASMKYPTWPNFESDGCNTIPSNTGFGITISCGTGGFALTQINSGYACNNIDISVSGFSGSQFTVVATAQSGSVNNTFTIGSDGDYYLQFPYFLTNNLVTLQIGQGSGSGGVMTINSISTSSCPVATNTPTANPSNTATNTPVPVTGTPTPIPTFTPLPSGHNTFTPTPDATATTGSATATGTATASPTPGISVRNCGDASSPLLNCDMAGGSTGGTGADGTPGLYWFHPAGHTAPPALNCYNVTGGALIQVFNGQGTVQVPCSQTVTAHATGTLYLQYNYTGSSSTDYDAGLVGQSSFEITGGSITCTTLASTYCNTAIGSVVAGTTYTLQFSNHVVCGLGANCTINPIYISTTFVGSSSGTNTPGPTSTVTATGTPTATPPAATQTAIAALTQTAIAASFTPTSVPIPGAPETPIPTDTECPGGCAVSVLTQVPGMSTRVTVDTSPFDPLKNMSLTRSSCVPFGYLQIPMPHIIGTPAFGSTTPLSYTWTTPITGPWDNSIISGSIVLTNTALQPCGMSEIPTFVWDLTYWLSVIMLAVGWFLWLIGFVGRLSGEETING